jgi:hypothetical protein
MESSSDGLLNILELEGKIEVNVKVIDGFIHSASKELNVKACRSEFTLIHLNLFKGEKILTDIEIVLEYESSTIILIL